MLLNVEVVIFLAKLVLIVKMIIVHHALPHQKERWIQTFACVITDFMMTIKSKYVLHVVLYVQDVMVLQIFVQYVQETDQLYQHVHVQQVCQIFLMHLYLQMYQQLVYKNAQHYVTIQLMLVLLLQKLVKLLQIRL